MKGMFKDKIFIQSNFNFDYFTGTTMNDNSPIVNIKRAIVSLRKEIQQMNLQLAVLMWCVIDRQTRVHKNTPQIKI